MNYSLQKCPFCFGHQARLIDQEMGFKVECQCCNANGPIKEVRIEAIESWNSLSEEIAKACNEHASQYATKLKALAQKLAPLSTRIQS